MDFPVSALTTYNNDRIAGGAFSIAGGHTATGIARWDGSTWSPLGQGVVGWYNWVRVLAVYNGGLVAGGYFDRAGGRPANHIARWDGASWTTLAEGTDQEVESLKVFERLLVVGGAFDQAGSIAAHKIARWGGPTVLPNLAMQRESGTARPPILTPLANPGKGRFLIQYRIAQTDLVEVDIYDASGALVRRLQEGMRPAGTYLARWDGRAETGRELPSGIYVARISMSAGSAAARLTLVR